METAFCNEAEDTAELGKQVAEMTLERNQLRVDLAKARREAEYTARARRDMEATFLKQAKDMQTKAMQSLQTMKDMRLAEQAKLRIERDRAESKCAELEGRCRGLEEDLLRKTQQLEQTRQLRTTCAECAEREYTERLKEASERRQWRMELTHARAELSDARRTASVKEDEVRTLRTKVSDMERRLWDAERKLDLETTKLKLKYENRIAHLERQYASSDDE